MSSLLHDDEREPDYGKVSELCLKLGYGTRDAAGRSYMGLSNKTIKFRKEFKDRGVEWFPVTYDHDVVKECTKEFLDANEELFRTAQHKSRGPWLDKPEDKEL